MDYVLRKHTTQFLNWCLPLVNNLVLMVHSWNIHIPQNHGDFNLVYDCVLHIFQTLEWCLDLGINEVTVYAFSIETAKDRHRNITLPVHNCRKQEYLVTACSFHPVIVWRTKYQFSLMNLWVYKIIWCIYQIIWQDDEMF